MTDRALHDLLAEQIRERIVFLRESGVFDLAARPSAGAASDPVISAAAGMPRAFDAPLAEPYLALAGLQSEIGECTRCRLSERRTKLVFGTGSPQARVMFVGEGPGYEEDRQGLPFVGKAGQLLNRIIQAMGMQREEVYIANVVKCRPPENRTPLPDECETCLPFLRRQIEIIRPQVICALGSVAVGALLQTSGSISRLRGTLRSLADGTVVMPTFHPAYLLRNPEKKKEVWEDMKMVMDFLARNPRN